MARYFAVSNLFDDRYGYWTRNADGKPVIWNESPYRNPVTGKLNLLLLGENKRVLTDLSVHLKRIKEYYLLEWRDKQKIKSRLTTRRDK